METRDAPDPTIAVYPRKNAMNATGHDVTATGESTTGLEDGAASYSGLDSHVDGIVNGEDMGKHENLISSLSGAYITSGCKLRSSPPARVASNDVHKRRRVSPIHTEFGPGSRIPPGSLTGTSNKFEPSTSAILSTIIVTSVSRTVPAVTSPTSSSAQTPSTGGVTGETIPGSLLTQAASIAAPSQSPTNTTVLPPQKLNPGIVFVAVVLPVALLVIATVVLLRFRGALRRYAQALSGALSVGIGSRNRTEPGPELSEASVIPFATAALCHIAEYRNAPDSGEAIGIMANTSGKHDPSNKDIAKNGMRSIHTEMPRLLQSENFSTSSTSAYPDDGRLMFLSQDRSSSTIAVHDSLNHPAPPGKNRNSVERALMPTQGNAVSLIMREISDMRAQISDLHMRQVQVGQRMSSFLPHEQVVGFRDVPDEISLAPPTYREEE